MTARAGNQGNGRYGRLRQVLVHRLQNGTYIIEDWGGRTEVPISRSRTPRRDLGYEHDGTETTLKAAMFNWKIT